jgi:hypothetical protein
MGSGLHLHEEGSMAAITGQKFPAQIVYFDSEGRQNLNEVLRVIKKALSKREELRSLKIVFFTAEGQGPALAYSKLREFKPKMIAVTFPPHFSVKRADNEERYSPRIADDIRDFFDGVKIKVVVPPSLPFDLIDHMDGHNQQVLAIHQTIAMFGSGFGLCIQAVLRACDVGLLEEGELVIAISGDTAGLFSASTTSHFLNKRGGLQVQEIFCKARNLTISRPTIKQLGESQEKKILEGEVSP